MSTTNTPSDSAAEYTDELRNVVRDWRWGTWHRLPATQRKVTPEPAADATVSDAMVRCAWLLCHAYGGAHHVGKVTLGAGERYLAVTHHGSTATADGADLTRLVIAAHEVAVRLEIQPGGPHGLRILLHPRIRSARIATNHPTIDNAIATLRERWAPCPIGIPTTEETTW